MDALEALAAIKDEAVRKFCLRRLEKARDMEEKTLAAHCLTDLADESSLDKLERLEARGDYDPGFFDLGERLLILKVILRSDLAGTSKESQMLAKHERKERERLKNIPKFLKAFL